MSERSISADDKMEVPIDNVMYWTCRLLSRFLKAKRGGITPDTLNDAEMSELEKDYWDREEELRQAYLVAMRLRWKEVVKHCEDIGLRGVSKKWVMDNPFLVAAAYGSHCGFEDWSDGGIRGDDG